LCTYCRDSIAKLHKPDCNEEPSATREDAHHARASHIPGASLHRSLPKLQIHPTTTRKRALTGPPNTDKLARIKTIKKPASEMPPKRAAATKAAAATKDATTTKPMANTGAKVTKPAAPAKKPATKAKAAAAEEKPTKTRGRAKKEVEPETDAEEETKTTTKKTKANGK